MPERIRHRSLNRRSVGLRRSNILPTGRHPRRHTHGRDGLIKDVAVQALETAKPEGQTPAHTGLGPVIWTSILLGITIAMIIAGLVARLGEVFSGSNLPGSLVNGAVIGTALISLAIGVRVPQRFALWICAQAWQRFLSRGRPADVGALLLNSANPDRSLYWVVLSAIALCAGVMTALLPLHLGLVEGAYGWMLEHFIWSPAPLSVLHGVLAFAGGVLPLTILGLALSCVHHLSCPFGQWEARPMAWLLVGGAGGVMISTWIMRVGEHVNLAVVSAALPALVISLTSAASGSARSRDLPSGTDAGPVPLPVCTDRWPGLLRAAMVAVGGGGACAMTVWAEHLGETTMVVIPAMLFSFGLGIGLGYSTTRDGLRSIGGFGVACLGAGIIVAAGSTCLPSGVSFGPVQVAVSACSGLAAVGFATAYGRQALLSRVGSRSFAGSAALTRSLVVAALTVWLGVPVVDRLLGAHSTLAMLALSLVCVGGVLVIFEPSQTQRKRRMRLGAVFGTVATMIAFFGLSSHPERDGSAGDLIPPASRSATILALPATE